MNKAKAIKQPSPQPSPDPPPKPPKPPKPKPKSKPRNPELKNKIQTLRRSTRIRKPPDRYIPQDNRKK